MPKFVSPAAAMRDDDYFSRSDWLNSLTDDEITEITLIKWRKASLKIQAETREYNKRTSRLLYAIQRARDALMDARDAMHAGVASNITKEKQVFDEAVEAYWRA